MGKSDDARWTAVQREYWAVADKLSELAWSFVDRPPTTLVGLATLTRYAGEYTDAGNEWPNRRHFFNDGVYDGYEEGRWEEGLLLALADSLGALAAGEA